MLIKLEKSLRDNDLKIGIANSDFFRSSDSVGGLKIFAQKLLCIVFFFSSGIMNFFGYLSKLVIYQYSHHNLVRKPIASSEFGSTITVSGPINASCFVLKITAIKF